MAEMPVIDREKCQEGCSLCVSVCRCGALVVINNMVTLIETEDCLWCTLCEVVCPNEAISCPFEVVIEEG